MYWGISEKLTEVRSIWAENGEGMGLRGWGCGSLDRISSELFWLGFPRDFDRFVASMSSSRFGVSGLVWGLDSCR